MKRKDGKPRMDYDRELDNLILDLLCEKRYLSVDRARTLLNDRYARKLGWLTIKRRMDVLLKNDKIKVFYETEEGKRKIVIYVLNK